jgi:hypothetical protein
MPGRGSWSESTAKPETRAIVINGASRKAELPAPGCRGFLADLNAEIHADRAGQVTWSLLAFLETEAIVEGEWAGSLTDARAALAGRIDLTG